MDNGEKRKLILCNFLDKSEILLILLIEDVCYFYYRKRKPETKFYQLFGN